MTPPEVPPATEADPPVEPRPRIAVVRMILPRVRAGALTLDKEAPEAWGVLYPDFEAEPRPGGPEPPPPPPPEPDTAEDEDALPDPGIKQTEMNRICLVKKNLSKYSVALPLLPWPFLLKSSLSEMTENGSLQIRPSANKKAKCEGPTSICLSSSLSSLREKDDGPVSCCWWSCCDEPDDVEGPASMKTLGFKL